MSWRECGKYVVQVLAREPVSLHPVEAVDEETAGCTGEAACDGGGKGALEGSEEGMGVEGRRRRGGGEQETGERHAVHRIHLPRRIKTRVLLLFASSMARYPFPSTQPASYYYPPPTTHSAYSTPRRRHNSLNHNAGSTPYHAHNYLTVPATTSSHRSRSRSRSSHGQTYAPQHHSRTHSQSRHAHDPHGYNASMHTPSTAHSYLVRSLRLSASVSSYLFPCRTRPAINHIATHLPTLTSPITRVPIPMRRHRTTTPLANVPSPSATASVNSLVSTRPTGTTSPTPLMPGADVITPSPVTGMTTNCAGATPARVRGSLAPRIIVASSTNTAGR